VLSSNRCRFCHQTFAQRNCGRVQRLENGDVSGRAVRRVCFIRFTVQFTLTSLSLTSGLQQTRNTPSRVLTEFASVDDILSFGPILAAVLSMHDPYPEYSPPEVDDKHLAPEVDPAVYPICAGKWQLAPHCQLLLPDVRLHCRKGFTLYIYTLT
jgi:hypothetical protein